MNDAASPPNTGFFGVADGRLFALDESKGEFFPVAEAARRGAGIRRGAAKLFSRWTGHA